MLELFLAVALIVTLGLEIYLINLVLLPVISVTSVLVSTIVAVTLGLHTLSLAYNLKDVLCVEPICVLQLYVVQ